MSNVSITVSETRDFLKPKKVYIPLASTKSKYYDLFVYEGDEVAVGEKIAERFGDLRTPIFSSVSGKVVGIESMEFHSGIHVDHLVIENDMKETLCEDVKPLEGEETARNIQRKIEELGIRGLDQTGMYTRFDFTKRIDHVVINAVFQNEPFAKVGYDFFKGNTKEIVEGVKLLGKAAFTDVTVIVPKGEDYSVFTNEGINVHAVNTKKPAWHYTALTKIVGRELPFDLASAAVMFVSIASAKAVYDAVKTGMPVVSRRVTVMGDALASNATYEVKIGTNISDLMNDLGRPEDIDEVSVYSGSIMNGRTMASCNFAISEHISSIGIQIPRDIENHVCTKCGRCNDACPVGILPQNIMDSELRMIDERIYELDVNKCIECGRCSYVCPSEINVLEWVRRAKRRIK
ncbi:4Fe-4S dicluster domain-containing protein [Mycoplasmatota bacterium WC44]